MNRTTLLIVFLVFASACCAEAKTVLLTEVQWTCTLTPAAGTETIDFTCLVPKSMPPFQRVDRLRFSHDPVERLTRGEDAFARFFFRGVKSPIVITITAQLELAPGGLGTARAHNIKPLTEPQRKAWTDPETYLESADPAIIDLAKSVNGNGRDAQLRQIQSLVEAKLKRGEDDLADHGAVAALSKGVGDCTEHADLFVALCRAKAIPAVVCDGFVVDVGLIRRKTQQHNWAMVWFDDRGWVRFDPLDTATRLAPFDTQSAWYVHLSNQRNNPTLNNSHLYSFRGSGEAIAVEHKFEILRKETRQIAHQ